jgi:hypothetical protein
MRYRCLTVVALCAIWAGCGTTKWTDTRRSATEQLLISDAIDRAVSRLDFRALDGKTVWLDATPLKSATDSEYLVSSLRQHLLASGCILKEKETEADYVVEARAGAVGTDRHDLIYGIPSVNIPAVFPIEGVGIPSKIPEVPFITRTNQRAVAKIAVFAYCRETGRPLWQSGTVPVQSKAKAVWVFGAGPFQRGTIHQGTEFAGNRLKIPLVDFGRRSSTDSVSVADEAYFVEPDQQLARKPKVAPTPKDAPGRPDADDGTKPPGPASEVIRTGHNATDPQAGSVGTPLPNPPTVRQLPADPLSPLPPGWVW